MFKIKTKTKTKPATITPMLGVYYKGNLVARATSADIARHGACAIAARAVGYQVRSTYVLVK